MWFDIKPVISRAMWRPACLALRWKVSDTWRPFINQIGQVLRIWPLWSQTRLGVVLKMLGRACVQYHTWLRAICTTFLSTGYATVYVLFYFTFIWYDRMPTNNTPWRTLSLYQRRKRWCCLLVHLFRHWLPSLHSGVQMDLWRWRVDAGVTPDMLW